jgi:NADPH:quinone reductase-like Zn-dependent oxidoreductase
MALPSGRNPATLGNAGGLRRGGRGDRNRARNGSHAERVTVPASNVVEVSTSLPWTDLVALPEVYATAWAGLHQDLGLLPGQTVSFFGSAFVLGTSEFPLAEIPARRDDRQG